MICDNIVCLSYIKNKNFFINIKIILIPGFGKLFYKNLLDLNFIKSIYLSYNIINFIFNNNILINYNIYINIKPNNIKKIGNSCGLAIFIALYTIILKYKLKKDLAVTGIINNKLNIIPVGGLKKKLNFSKINNIKTIILPEFNKFSYKINFNLIKVNNIKEVINLIMNI